MTVEGDEERRQNAISNRTASILIPYSDARSINIQLHQDRIALSILLPFSRFLPANAHSRTFPPGGSRRICAYHEGLAKDGKEKREEAECMYISGRALYTKVHGVQSPWYNNVCTPAFQIDSSGH